MDLSLPSMSAPTSPEPRAPEEASIIPDQLMVFRSTQDASSMTTAKKLAFEKAKMEIKLQKCTPAPPTKGDGQKRMILSPLPEDKQLRKKIDFEEETSPTMDAPRCKGSIFPANSTHGLEEGSKNMEDEEAPIK